MQRPWLAQLGEVPRNSGFDSRFGELSEFRVNRIGGEGFGKDEPS